VRYGKIRIEEMILERRKRGKLKNGRG